MERHLLRAAARYADICNVGFEMGLYEHGATLDVLGGHCRNVGRDLSEIEVSHNTRVVIAGSEAEFDGLVSQGAADANLSAAEYRESLSRAIAGTPEQCVEQIKGYVDSGITYFFLLFPDPHPHRYHGAIRQGSDAEVCRNNRPDVVAAAGACRLGQGQRQLPVSVAERTCGLG